MIDDDDFKLDPSNEATSDNEADDNDDCWWSLTSLTTRSSYTHS